MEQQIPRTYSFASDYIMICSAPECISAIQCSTEVAKCPCFGARKVVTLGVVKCEHHHNTKNIIHKVWERDHWTKR